MAKIKIPDEALTEAVKSVDKHIGETYDSAINPSANEIGSGISSIVHLVFSPFRYFGSKADIYFQNKLKLYTEELVNKEKSIPEDKKVEPDFQTVSLALDDSKFCITNDILRKMFVNLIGCTMHSDKKEFAHPAFAEIIKQMSSQDAMILKSFISHDRQPIINVYKTYEKGHDRIFTNLYYIKIDDIPYNAKTYSESIVNLERLGLVSIAYTSWFTNDSQYDNLKIITSNITEHTDKDKIYHEKGIVSLSPLGERFIEICVSE